MADAYSESVPNYALRYGFTEVGALCIRCTDRRCLLWVSTVLWKCLVEYFLGYSNLAFTLVLTLQLSLSAVPYARLPQRHGPRPRLTPTGRPRRIRNGVNLSFQLATHAASARAQLAAQCARSMAAAARRLRASRDAAQPTPGRECVSGSNPRVVLHAP